MAESSSEKPRIPGGESSAVTHGRLSPDDIRTIEVATEKIKKLIPERNRPEIEGSIFGTTSEAKEAQQKQVRAEVQKAEASHKNAETPEKKCDTAFEWALVALMLNRHGERKTIERDFRWAGKGSNIIKGHKGHDFLRQHTDAILTLRGSLEGTGSSSIHTRIDAATAELFFLKKFAWVLGRLKISGDTGNLPFLNVVGRGQQLQSSNLVGAPHGILGLTRGSVLNILRDFEKEEYDSLERKPDQIMLLNELLAEWMLFQRFSTNQRQEDQKALTVVKEGLTGLPRLERTDKRPSDEEISARQERSRKRKGLEYDRDRLEEKIRKRDWMLDSLTAAVSAVKEIRLERIGAIYEMEVEDFRHDSLKNTSLTERLGQVIEQEKPQVQISDAYNILKEVIAESKSQTKTITVKKTPTEIPFESIAMLYDFARSHNLTTAPSFLDYIPRDRLYHRIMALSQLGDPDAKSLSQDKAFDLLHRVERLRRDQNAFPKKDDEGKVIATAVQPTSLGILTEIDALIPEPTTLVSAEDLKKAVQYRESIWNAVQAKRGHFIEGNVKAGTEESQEIEDTDRLSDSQDGNEGGGQIIEDERKGKISAKKRKKAQPRAGDPERRQVIGGGGATQALVSDGFDQNENKYSSAVEKTLPPNEVRSVRPLKRIQEKQTEGQVVPGEKPTQIQVERIRRRLEILEMLELKRRIVEARKKTRSI